MTSAIKTCPRCGIRRTVTTRSHNLCASCRTARIHTDPNLGLPPGEWVNHGLTKRWVPADVHTPCAARPFTQPSSGVPLTINLERSA